MDGIFDSKYSHAYGCLSQQAIGSHSRSDLFVNSDSDQHIPSQNRFRSKSTLQDIRLRTVSHETAHRLAEEET